jgi:HTH-type transcriptional regulator/antitoxin HigA
LDEEKSEKMKNLDQSSALPEISQAWAKLQSVALIRTIRNEADFERMHAYANELSDEVGDDENHPLYSLFEIVMDIIDRWEGDHVIIPDSPPREVLRFLLEENGLKQKDLAEIASPALISDILSGRREISKKLARSLASRFNTSVEVFV